MKNLQINKQGNAHCKKKLLGTGGGGKKKIMRKVGNKWVDAFSD